MASHVEGESVVMSRVECCLMLALFVYFVSQWIFRHMYILTTAGVSQLNKSLIQNRPDCVINTVTIEFISCCYGYTVLS